MGGGTSSQKLEEVSETIESKQQYTQLDSAVEEFAEQCYLDGSKPDGLNLILTNPRGRKAFMKFLNTENGVENIKFFEEMEKLRKINAMTDADAAQQAQGIIDGYKKPVNPTFVGEAAPSDENASTGTDIEKVEKASTATEIEKVENPTETTNTTSTGQAIGEDFLTNVNSIAGNETMVFMAFNVFPNFIGSQAYKDWRKEESDIAKKQVTVFKASGKHKGPVNGPEVPPVVVPADSLAAGTVGYIDASKIGSIFRYGSWLGAYVAAAEGLPICVTLADANPANANFPLIYVNKVFEETTLHKREAIRNTNCKFLQGPKSEDDSIKLLSSNLANGQPIKVAITNYRKDKTLFKNLLALKPVFDLDGNYRYVCGVQFDITNPGANAKAMKLVDSLINLLPNVVPVGSEE